MPQLEQVWVEQDSLTTSKTTDFAINERSMLEALIKQEKPGVAQYRKRNAGIVLAMDENNDPLTYDQVAKVFRVRPLTIWHQQSVHDV